jgi:DNA repair exonuclease SbcCD ATPase subunit
LILFKKLRWKNLLSTGNIFTEIELNKTNNTLIVGENGAGKSTILDALSFALFGKPFRKINKPQLVNTITRKDLVVEVEFNIGVNQYKIIRGLKPAVFEVYQNGTMLNQSAEMRDYQEILEKQILKINHKSFCQVVVLGSATFMPFMQLPGGQRREIIEDLLDLQIFTTMNSLLKDKIADNNDSVIQANAEQKFITEKIELVKKHMLEVQNNNEKIVKQKYELIEETNFKISELDVKYWNLNKEIEDDKELTVDKDELNRRANKLSSLKHQIEAKRALIENDIKFFEKHENCPTCTQAISADFREITVHKKHNEIETIDDGLEQLIEQYKEASQRLSEIMEIESSINSKY